MPQAHPQVFSVLKECFTSYRRVNCWLHLCFSAEGNLLFRFLRKIQHFNIWIKAWTLHVPSRIFNLQCNNKAISYSKIDNVNVICRCVCGAVWTYATEDVFVEVDGYVPSRRPLCLQIADQYFFRENAPGWVFFLAGRGQLSSYDAVAFKLNICVAESK